jgi:predicted nucleic acid-binding Zn ribbon protein
MRKGNEQSVGEVINQLIDAYKLRDRINEVRLTHAWESRMGEAIARRTTRLHIRNRVLVIEVSSAPLRQELFNSRERIRTVLNEALEGDFIDDVKIR